MSQITDVHNALILKVEGCIPAYKKIANPYDIANNPGSILNKGFAVAIGPGVNQLRTTKCEIFELRSFEVILVRLATHTENNVSKRVSLEQEIMEDAYLIKEKIECEGVDLCSRATFVEDSGLQYVVPENEDVSRDKYYIVTLSFDVEYREICDCE